MACNFIFILLVVILIRNMTTDLIKKIVDSFGGWKKSYFTLLVILFIFYIVYKIWINYIIYLVIIGLVLLYLNERSKNKEKSKK